MKKRIVGFVLSAVFIVLLGNMNVLAAPSVALSQQCLVVDGKMTSCELYNIDGSNFIKLRDLAYILNGTGSQFSVDWDSETNAVSINTGKAYESNGSEIDASCPDNHATSVVSSQTIQIDGNIVTDLSVYNIGGSNYFKLRELNDALWFGVDFDAEAKAVIVDSITTVNVSTAAELLNAIAPNTRVILSSGTYNVSLVNIASVNNDYVSWETVYDGTEVIVTGVKNCIISGSVGAESTSVVVEPRYADVLSFSDCFNISIDNLTIGHTTEPGYCTGGVLNFSDSENVGIESCVLYGCGTLGIIANEVNGLTVSDTEIKDCTYGIMSVSASSSLSFENCSFYDCVGYTMMTFDNCDDVSFDGCLIKNNFAGTGWGDSLIFLSVCDTVTVTDCTISDNSMDYMIKVFNCNAVSFNDNTIEDNTFAEGVLAEGSDINVVFSPAL